ncbi:MAG: response regulator transcription factor [Candidatus Atribacteria bacterium]|nr:response regulator transcription factor [Candidatus Atribacteria bacterium]
MEKTKDYFYTIFQGRRICIVETLTKEKTIKVFLVDDNPFLLDSLQFLLERQGDLKVVGKSLRGKGVLPKLKRAKPDVVVLDVRLGDSDGLLLLEKIRQNLPLPVVMLSMYEEYREYALRLGAFAYLVKGKDLEELYQTLRLATLSL